MEAQSAASTAVFISAPQAQAPIYSGNRRLQHMNQNPQLMYIQPKLAGHPQSQQPMLLQINPLRNPARKGFNLCKM